MTMLSRLVISLAWMHTRTGKEAPLRMHTMSFSRPTKRRKTMFSLWEVARGWYVFFLSFFPSCFPSFLLFFFFSFPSSFLEKFNFFYKHTLPSGHSAEQANQKIFFSTIVGDRDVLARDGRQLWQRRTICSQCAKILAIRRLRALQRGTRLLVCLPRLQRLSLLWRLRLEWKCHLRSIRLLRL